MAFEVIEYFDNTGRIMVARVPEQGSGEFVTGSQLIVQESQIAVFYRDGRMADQFPAGRYTLSTQNLPIIQSMVKLPFQGKSPFRAYVYFVSLKVFPNIGWGTAEPILYRDRELKMVNLRGHGTFSVRIFDHVRFLNNIVGTRGIEKSDDIEDFLRKLILARFAKTLGDMVTSVLELPSLYQEIEVHVKRNARDDFAQYGLELIDFVINSITMPPEVQRIIDRATGTRSMEESEISRYQQVAAADALLEAARTGGGEGLTAGLGIGAGLALGQQFAASIRPASTSPVDVSPPPLTGPEETPWYIAIQGKSYGPINFQQLIGYIKEGRVTENTLVWKKGMAEWKRARELPELNSILDEIRSEPPPLPEDAQ